MNATAVWCLWSENLCKRAWYLKYLLTFLWKCFLVFLENLPLWLWFWDVLVFRLILKSWYSHGLMAIWTSVICQSAVTKLWNFLFFNIRKPVCTVCSLRPCLLYDGVTTTDLICLNIDSLGFLVIVCLEVVVVGTELLTFHLKCWNGPYIALGLEWIMLASLVLQTLYLWIHNSSGFLTWFWKIHLG